MSYQRCPKCGMLAYARDYFSNGYYCFPNQGGCGTKFPVEIENINGLFCHSLPTNSFLKKEITAYFHDYYITTKDGGSDFSDMILSIKNNGTDTVKDNISKIIGEDLDKIIDINDIYRENRPIVIAVPRSKPDNFWQNCQLQFRPTILMGLKKSKYTIKGKHTPWIIDGINYLTRILETKTTHLSHLNNQNNGGSSPYPGITKDTCELNGDISEKNIILIDDIYTECKGIDEDCIQFLLDCGAKNVILYTLGMTKRSYKDPYSDVPF